MLPMLDLWDFKSRKCVYLHTIAFLTFNTINTIKSPLNKDQTPKTNLPSLKTRLSNILVFHITAYGSDMNKWDTRYNTEDYVFGKRPNRFLMDCVTGLAPGNALCLGEGEGHNAAYLASLGWEVTAVDISPYGIEKAQLLARQRGVKITTISPKSKTNLLCANIFFIWIHF